MNLSSGAVGGTCVHGPLRCGVFLNPVLMSTDITRCPWRGAWLGPPINQSAAQWAIDPDAAGMDTLTRCCFNVGPAGPTIKQQRVNISCVVFETKFDLNSDHACVGGDCFTKDAATSIQCCFRLEHSPALRQQWIEVFSERNTIHESKSDKLQVRNSV